MSHFRKKNLSTKELFSGKIFFLKWLTKPKPEIFFDYNGNESCKGGHKQLLARADITESTQWLSVKKRKRGIFILFQALVKRLLSPAV